MITGIPRLGRNGRRTSSLVTTTALAALSAAVAMPAGAQEQGRDWRVTPYLWGAGINGNATIGPIGRDIDMDFSDVVDLLAGAALIRVEGGNDEHGLMIDVVWLDLEPADEIATIGGVTEASFESTTLELNYVRKLDSLDLDFGLRYWDMDVELDPSLLPSIERGDDWVDAFVGVRFVRELSSSWAWQMRVNLGAGGSDATLGFETHFARALSGGNRIVLGLKSLSIDYHESSVNGLPFEIDTTFIGTTVGFMFD